jgi:hypothetical protein
MRLGRMWKGHAAIAAFGRGECKRGCRRAVGQAVSPAEPAPASPRESGYALLMVFLLAALIALSLYSVMPRVTFESERDQEQMLIDRGSQYKRAIQLYYHKFRRYPAKMEDLENSNGQRFLRQRYNDPLTGKNEWRLIHVGPGGALTDSLTQKSNTPAKDTSSANTFITELKPIGDNSTPIDAQTPLGLRRRPSDGGQADSDPNAPPVPISLPTGGNSAPSGGYEVGGAFNANGTQSASATDGFSPSGLPPGVQPDAQGYVPGGEMNPNAPGNSTVTPQSFANGNPVFPNGSAPPTSPNDVIRNLLTSPRPGGPPPGIFNPSGRPMNDVGFTDGGANGPPVPVPTSSTSVGGGGFPGGGSFGGGQAGSTLGGSASGSGAPGGFVTGSFAGVASTVKRPSIKIYNDHQKYNEWEFIFDYGKEALAAAGIQVNGNVPNPLAPGQQANQSNASNPFTSGNSFGTGNAQAPTPPPQPPPNQ